MKNKTWFKISYFSLLFGWFPFIWLAVWGSWNREVGLIVALFGLSLCLFSSMMSLPFLRDEDLFKSIEELEKERELYLKARKRLEQKIIEL